MSSQQKNILVFNVGSSSVKAALYHGKHELMHLNIDRVTSPKKRSDAVTTVARAVELSGFKLSAIAHRIVHGGPIKKHCVITSAIFSKLKKISVLAPLHDIPELEVVSFCKKKFGSRIKQIAVFDTAFHSTMPEHATVYGLPYKEYLQGIRRYGFHGISHSFVTRGLKGRVISCHLGGGSSISAIKNGKSINNTMGFTPLEGIVMSTRSGSIDPGIVTHFYEHDKMSFARIKHLLNHESGILGIYGKSSDMRDVLAARKKNKRAKLALDVFVHSVVKNIGAYVAVLGGVDTIVFTGGIGQNSPPVRKLICEQLSAFKVSLDTKRNLKNSRVVSSGKSHVKVLAIPTNEELEMVQVASKLI